MLFFLNFCCIVGCAMVMFRLKKIEPWHHKLQNQESEGFFKSLLDDKSNRSDEDIELGNADLSKQMSMTIQNPNAKE